MPTRKSLDPGSSEIDSDVIWSIQRNKTLVYYTQGMAACKKLLADSPALQL